VLELISTNFINGVYEGIAEAIGLEHEFLLCKGDADFRAEVDIVELKRLVDK